MRKGLNMALECGYPGAQDCWFKRILFLLLPFCQGTFSNKILSRVMAYPWNPAWEVEAEK